MIILLFGQPASGKTTLSEKLSTILPVPFTIKIDGDRWREITKNKNYTKEGRLQNLKGAFDMALYLEKEGFLPILSFVTPYQELRDHLKANAEAVFQFFLSYEGDRGRNERFVQDFELPDLQDVVTLNTSELDIDECTRIILSKITDYYVEKGNAR